MTIEIARLAVETCMFPLWETVNGEYMLSPQSKIPALSPDRKKPIREYLRMQRRFGHLFNPKFEHVSDDLQRMINKRWKQLLKKCNMVSEQN